MKRLAAIGLFVLGLAVAGAFSGTVVAEITTSTSATTTAATTTPPTTTAVTTTAPTGSRPTIPRGVRVAGVRVGGMTPQEAVVAVQTAFARPLTVVVDRTTLVLDPRAFASAYVPTAVARARISEPQTNTRLVVSVRGAAVRAWARKVSKRFARPVVDATLGYRNERPVIRDDKTGRVLSSTALTRRVIAALANTSRLPIHMRTDAVAPEVGADAFAHIIVINRAANTLDLYDGEKLARTFRVATGQPSYPTPRGDFQIVVMYKNPWWYPPTSSPWAKGLKPVPPGPSNPLGTRWMGISSPGVGIHGTNSASSIGYSVSHGCIRMQVPEAEWLFAHVTVGTPVHIV